MKSTSESKQHGSVGDLDAAERKSLDISEFAFPRQRKEPLNDAAHVRNAIARFDQVKDVTDAEREDAFQRIKKAAKKFGITLEETSWKQLGNKPHTRNRSQD